MSEVSEVSIWFLPNGTVYFENAHETLMPFNASLVQLFDIRERISGIVISVQIIRSFMCVNTSKNDKFFPINDLLCAYATRENEFTETEMYISVRQRQVLMFLLEEKQKYERGQSCNLNKQLLDLLHLLKANDLRTTRTEDITAQKALEIYFKYIEISKRNFPSVVKTFSDNNEEILDFIIFKCKKEPTSYEKAKHLLNIRKLNVPKINGSRLSKILDELSNIYTSLQTHS